MVQQEFERAKEALAKLQKDEEGNYMGFSPQ